MKNRAALLFASVFSFAVAASAATDPTPGEIRSFAAAAGPKWSVEQFKYGDLSGRKTNDAVIMLAINPEHAFGAAEDRKLVIAMRGPDGKLRAVAGGRNAVPLGAGPAGGDPELEIKRNSVFLSQFGGSREKGTDTYQYKNINGTWRLIGMTSEWYDSLAEDIPTTKTDVNFLTNYVEASRSTQKGRAKQVELYELPSVRGTPPATGAWKAPYLVRDGVRMQSMHDANTLYIRVTGSNGFANLICDRGRLVIPTKRSANGNEETLSFSLKKRPFADALSDRSEAAFFRLKMLSAGGILFMPTSEPYTLQNVDVRESSVHPQVFSL